MTPFEAVIASKLIEQGYDVLTSGWPDFCAIKQEGGTTEVRFIEVKGRGDALRPSQQKMHKILRVLGLEVEVIQEDAQHRMQYPPLLLSGVKVTRHHLGGRPALARQAAILFLEKELKGGPALVRDILRKCLNLRICSRGTLYRTKDAMRLTQKILGNDVVWELPETQMEEQNP
jgi:hypothetical protein